MSKLWSGRFSGDASSLLDEFNASLGFDKTLYKEDIEGSIAHVRMLCSRGVLNEKERDLIIDGLKDVQDEIEEGVFKFDIADEDIHMAIEKRLTEIIGNVGKKLHTARSRNDQVALDFRLYTQRKNRNIASLLLELIDTLVTTASRHAKTVMPGMTHLQHAQPINFGFHMLAYANMFKRDYLRIQSAYSLHNLSPLGCAALAGTPYKNDRSFIAKELGFEGISANCLDTVSDRDFALDLLYNISMIMMHISRLSEELVIWSSYEFKFITISDAFSTGSSIMPQKKNPDVPELLRGKSGRVFGNLFSLFTVMKGLPLAYNKDTQEDKEGVFDSVATVELSLRILSAMLKEIEVNPVNMLSAAKTGHLTATDLADYLVEKIKVPFREAHEITGRVVAYAERHDVDISELEYSELKAVDSRIREDVLSVLDLENSMNSRDSVGGTSTSQTLYQVKEFEQWLADTRNQEDGNG